MTDRQDLALQALLELPPTNGGTTTDHEMVEKAGHTFDLEELALAADYLVFLGYLRTVRSMNGSEYELLEEGREYKKRLGR